MRVQKTSIGYVARRCALDLRRLTLAMSIGISGACAAASIPLLDQAQSLLARREPAAAYALLASVETVHAGSPEFDYLLGIAALDAGHVTRAIFALERAVDARPANRLARAELGRAYLAAGDTARAKEQLEQARGSDTPPEATAAIDRVLSVIDQGVIDQGMTDSGVPRPGTRVTGYLEVGAGYDSNVNSATNQGEFAIPAFGGILFQTTSESRRRGALVANGAAGAFAELPLSRDWSLVGAANVRRAVNRDVHELDTVLVDATAGVRHTAGSQSQTLALQSGLAWVGSRRYREVSGATAQWQSQFDKDLQGSVFGQWSRQNFPGEIGRDNDRSVLGLGVARSFSGGATLAYGSVYLARERAGTEFAFFGHRGRGARLGLEQRLSDRLTLFGEAQLEDRRHDGDEPFFETARHDRQNDASAGLRYRGDDRWEITALMHYTRAASNVVLYDYVRNTFQLTLRRNFQ